MRPNLLLSLVSLVLLTSCWRSQRYIEPPARNVLGYKAVFTHDSTILRIASDTARKVRNAGKIYALGNLIFQNELGEGIHVLDKTNPAAVKNLGFIRIKGNSEMSIKGTTLYANCFADLVVIDISNWRQPIELKRIKDAFTQGNSAGVAAPYQFIPLPERNVYFECMKYYRDSVQIGWKKDSITDHNCYYQ